MTRREHFLDPSKESIAWIIRPILEALLGRMGLRVLEYHLEKLLQKDPYDVLCSDPHSFYLALRNLFGRGADNIIQIIAKRMIEENILDARDPGEFLEALKDPQGGREKILRMLGISEDHNLE